MGPLVIGQLGTGFILPKGAGQSECPFTWVGAATQFPQLPGAGIEPGPEAVPVLGQLFLRLWA